MSETTETARRWNGYVCPDCRFVFRVPRDHDGKGIICPSCRRMLRIPAVGDTPPPLTKKSLKIMPVSMPETFQRGREKPRVETLAAAEAISSRTEPVAVEPQPARIREKKRRRAEAGDEEQPDWDKVAKSRRRIGSGGSKALILKVVVIVMLLLTAVVALTFVIQRKKSDDPNQVVTASPVAIPEVKESVADPIELPLEMNRNEAELVAELEPLTKRFLEATTVDELLPLVRDHERLEPKIRKFYPDGKVTAVGLSAFNVSGNIAFRSKLASVSVRTRDFELKQVAFIRMADGLKIDWESYVGWSEMSWAEFLAKKPTTPVLFRASLKAVEYYNFSFSDDRKWSSFQFRSPDGESVVYGYAKKDSPDSERLRPNDPASATLVTVRLKFLPGETSKNQVIIDSVVADGWVEGIDDK